ncbi:unnamed protein product [Lathyrus sativus]|nr:unnamed protein product [Lathyrus sativus]
MKHVEVKYLHDYVGVFANVGLTANSIVNLSGVIGTNVIALDHDLSYDTKTSKLTKFNMGLNFTKEDLVASLVLNEKANVLNVSYYHVVNPFTKIVIDVEVTHRFSIKENTFTLGTQHALDPSME